MAASRFGECEQSIQSGNYPLEKRTFNVEVQGRAADRRGVPCNLVLDRIYHQDGPSNPLDI